LNRRWKSELTVHIEPPGGKLNRRWQSELSAHIEPMAAN
jgi:hypothetical protein